MGKMVIVQPIITEVNEVLRRNVSEIDNVPGVKLINTPKIWEIGEYGKGIIIAVLDSGCDWRHPDLNGQVIAGKNFTDIGSPDDYLDEHGHGTHVAGTIAAKLDGKGVVGVAPEAKLLILKVLRIDQDNPQNAIGNTDWQVAAIDYAISWRGPNQEKVRVISMSIIGEEGDEAYHEAIKRAIDNDIPVVTCAGNNGDVDEGGDCSPENDEISYPGIYPEVISVGAVKLDKSFPCYSATNSQVDIVAPGGDENAPIYSTTPNGGYGMGWKTSMAVPHVSGALALLINTIERELGRRLTEREIYAQLIKHTVSLGESKKREGNGLLDLSIK
ncbi:serine protease [Paenibacillus polymyxa]|uniref:S8 family peptidase n=1 Tax=Paenibacillus TaxID=44249 RepID=UPI00083D537A|nr:MULTISPECIES: S8 family peptidase [Paenibacillus]MCP3781570.1 S8 family peptidase [Paenibacillus sp. MZ03-122A]ODB55029.1 serine protease [Paenibacillus polymyxa]